MSRSRAVIQVSFRKPKVFKFAGVVDVFWRSDPRHWWSVSRIPGRRGSAQEERKVRPCQVCGTPRLCERLNLGDANLTQDIPRHKYPLLQFVCSPNHPMYSPLKQSSSSANTQRQSQTSVGVPLHRCSGRPPTSESGASGSATTSKAKDYSSKCKHAVRTVVSSMLLMPMPYLDEDNDEPRGLRRVISRQTRPTTTRRNSMVLPDVAMPHHIDEPEPWRPHRREIRDNPPPEENRMRTNRLGATSCEFLIVRLKPAEKRKRPVDDQALLLTITNSERYCAAQLLCM
ncbi:hypothetical protein R3P38DRAFT_1654304 [Favolaschia claudopus]|uniref:Uncharacterized protein n=1 Tax=Favolaschia claudopus TaxID=2862362 RepID=A0AAW0DPL7_9AGAR